VFRLATKEKGVVQVCLSGTAGSVDLHVHADADETSEACIALCRVLLATVDSKAEQDEGSKLQHVRSTNYTSQADRVSQDPDAAIIVRVIPYHSHYKWSAKLQSHNHFHRFTCCVWSDA
jgi:hypothetical protein